MIFFILFLLNFLLLEPVTKDFQRRLETLDYPSLELYLNNGFVRAIVDAPVDRITPLSYLFNARFRFMSEYTTHQYTGFNLVDSIMFVANQNRPTLGGNAQAAPVLDSFNLYGFVELASRGLRYRKAHISGKVAGLFGGLAAVGATLALWEAFFEVQQGSGKYFFGLKEHVFVQEFSQIISFVFGVPITPNISRVAQATAEISLGHSVKALLSLYTSYLVPEYGPYGFSDSYSKWSATPGVATCLKWQNKDFACGVGICCKALRPRIFTSNRFVGSLITQSVGTFLAPPVHNPDYVGANNEFIVGTKFMAFCSMDKSNIHTFFQIIAGSNGMEFFNLGGYGVTSFNRIINPPDVNPASINFSRTYKNIPFITLFTDISSKKYYCNIQPGFFMGYTQPLPMRNKLERDVDGQFSVYTIDALFQGIQSVTNPGFNKEKVFGLLRVAPRFRYELTDAIKIGGELTVLNTWYGKPNEYYKPLDKKSVRLVRATVCCFMDL